MSAFTEAERKELKALATRVLGFAVSVNDSGNQASLIDTFGLHLRLAVVDTDEPSGFAEVGQLPHLRSAWGGRDLYEESAMQLHLVAEHHRSSDEVPVSQRLPEYADYYKPGGVYCEVSILTGGERRVFGTMAVVAGANDPLTNKALATTAAQFFSSAWVRQIEALNAPDGGQTDG